MKETPNWLEIPDELMANILQRLGTKERLKSARRVCTTWRRICNDPSMWKVIVMYICYGDPETDNDLHPLTKLVVDLSGGELLDISMGGFGTDDLLNYIVLRSSKLKRLYLWYCDHMTGSGLSQAVKRLPQLEELKLSNIHINAEDIGVIGRNCPQLKSFKIIDLCTKQYVECDKQAVAIATNMPELRHLQIHGDEMTSNGVQAILNGCPHLESLDIYINYSFNLDGNLVKRCMERIKDFKHNSTQDSDDSDYMYSSGSDAE